MSGGAAATTIDVILDDPSSLYTKRFLSGAKQACNELSNECVIATLYLSKSPARDKIALKLLLGTNPFGVIVDTKRALWSANFYAKLIQAREWSF